MAIVKNLLRKLLRWVHDENDSSPKAPALCGDSYSVGMGATFRIGVLTAMNGKLLELGTYKPSNHGPDWTHQYFLVPEHQTTQEAIVMLLTIKGIE